MGKYSPLVYMPTVSKCKSERRTTLFLRDRENNGTFRPQDFSINCVDCAINGNVSLSAGGSIAGDQISTPSDVTEIPSNFDFSDFWVGATFDSFDAVFEFGINLTASTTENAFEVPINTTTISKKVCLTVCYH